MKASKIVWPEKWNSDPNSKDCPIFLVSVDGIHTQIFEPMNGTYSKNPKYYSHKFNQSALAYEIAISLWTNQVVWVNGPFPAGKPDREIFQEGLLQMIPKGKKVIADAAYLSQEMPMLRISNKTDSKEVALMKRRGKARQESFNAKVKKFKAMAETFRHGESKRPICFEAIVVICQYQIERSAPLFDI